MIKLFVGGFPLDNSEMDLAKLFIPYGDIETIKIVRDRATKKCKGYAFIEMKNKEGADNAIEALHDTVIGEKQLTVRIVEEKAQPVKNSRPFSTSSNSNYRKTAPSAPSSRPKRPRKTF